MTESLRIAHTNDGPLRTLPSATPPLHLVEQDRGLALKQARAYVATLPRGGPPKDYNIMVSDYAHEIIF